MNTVTNRQSESSNLDDMDVALMLATSKIVNECRMKSCRGESIMIRDSFEMKDLDEMITSAQQGNKKIQNDLLKTFKPFVAKCVSEVCKRYIDRSDDEFSIGLVGFNEAMIHYTPDKGSFFSFAQVVVKRKVIDYIRMTSRHPQFVSLDDYHDDQSIHLFESEAANLRYELEQESWLRREEIADFTKKLKAYRISFADLVKVAPKHQDARHMAVKIARIIVQDPKLKAYVKKRKKLPIKYLLKRVNLSKKTLERHRKYILAIFVVLDEDYVYLKEYLKGVGQ